MNYEGWHRRDIIKLVTALGLIPSASIAETEKMLTRPIPSSGESLPVIGLGTYSVFDVKGSAEEIATRQAIVDTLIDKGGSLLDSSPMYNRAEKIIGDLIRSGGRRDDVFLATKVWTDGKQAGIEQMQRSADLMNTEVIDLMQVHNLRDANIHMDTIREWQQDGRIRYSGITHYVASMLDEMEMAMRRLNPQFIQINYSLGEREAARRILPIAKEMDIAVLINRPFVAGKLFRAVGERALPDWAMHFADSWGQFFLKYIIANPAVTCVIPATSKLHHLTDNLGAGFGSLPDEGILDKMDDFIDSI